MVVGTTNTPPPISGGYRIKFKRDEFMKLLAEADPKRVYRVKDFIYFSYDGFVMYCEDLKENDLVKFKVYHAIEFSNTTWVKT